jgi:hypothetical protein
VQGSQQLVYPDFEQLNSGIGLDAGGMDIGQSNARRPRDLFRFKELALLVRRQRLEKSWEVILHSNKVFLKFSLSNRIVFLSGIDAN